MSKVGRQICFVAIVNTNQLKGCYIKRVIQVQLKNIDDISYIQITTIWRHRTSTIPILYFGWI